MEKAAVPLIFSRILDAPRERVWHGGIGLGTHTIQQYEQGWNEILDRLAQTVR